MRFSGFDVVFQEVPNEISLSFSITGCKVACKGCHSTYLWNKNNGELLTKELFIETINRYKTLISCVVFMGGEWYEDELAGLLTIATNMGYKTALYTGEEDVGNSIKNKLTFLKTGKYNEIVGGLGSPTTNQNFINVVTQENLNHLF